MSTTHHQFFLYPAALKDHLSFRASDHGVLNLTRRLFDGAEADETFRDKNQIPGCSNLQFHHIGILCLVVVVFLSGTLLHGQSNIVSNGDFETPNAGSTFVTYSSGRTFGGWTVEFGDIQMIGTYWQSFAGKQSVDLDGYQRGAIFQDIPTVPWHSYTLSFNLAGNPDGAPPTKQLQVWWGNNLIASPAFNITGWTRTNMGWQRLTVSSLVATSNITRLRFASLTDGAYGPVLDNINIPSSAVPIIVQTTFRGGGPCTNCCGIDHRQPLLSPDGNRCVFSSTWNVDDFAGNLNPDRNRELFLFNISSNKFQQVTITSNGMSLAYTFQKSNVGFISCSPQYGISTGTNMQVLGYDLATQSVTSWVGSTNLAPIQLGTNCPYTWFAATDWTNLANLHVDLSADEQHIVWASTR
ncbi:MAG: choice-of-anchor C family protein, partial [Verrucomicrobia bacterium]|nr:choice-of-anchor C family protein [Verrucomicrobiota bacterium]